MAFGRYNFSVVDDSGNVVNGASVEVRHETVGAPLAILFSDRDGTTPLANPYTASDGANAGFFVGGGAYRVTVTSGALSRDWRYVAVGTAQETDNSAIRPGALYQWDTGTTDADPGDGKIRANNASLASATFLYVDDVSHGNSNMESFLLSFDDSTNTIKGDLILVDLSLETSATFKITSITDAAGYVKIGVSNHSGETSFTADAEIGVQFFRAGDAGAAPADAVYIVQTLHGSLSAERALTDTASITWDFGTAGQAKANSTSKAVLFGSGGSGTCAAGATKYIGAALMSATEGEVVFPLPVAGTLQNLRILGNNPSSAGETLTCTLRKELADTALIATITNGTNVANDSTHTVSVSAGNRIGVKLVNSASGATQGPVSWSCELVI